MSYHFENELLESVDAVVKAEGKAKAAKAALTAARDEVRTLEGEFAVLDHECDKLHAKLKLEIAEAAKRLC